MSYDIAETIEQGLERIAAEKKQEVAAAFKRSQEIQREQLYKRINLNMRAHSRGEVAKSNGWARISPYYNDAVSDDFWFKGFDGVSFDKAIRCDLPRETAT